MACFFILANNLVKTSSNIFFFSARHCLGLLRMDMTSTPWTSSSGSPCSRISMRSSTTTTWTARSVSSAKSWGSPNTTEPLPRSSSPDSSKFKRKQQHDYAYFFNMTRQMIVFMSSFTFTFDETILFSFFSDTPSILRSWACPTTWGNFWTSTWMPTPELSRTRPAKSSSSAPTPSRIPWRGTPTETACKKLDESLIFYK